MRKFIPYIYILFAALILFDAFKQFLEERDIYRIIFNWTTESKYFFAGVKVLFATIILYGGVKRFKK